MSGRNLRVSQIIQQKLCTSQCMTSSGTDTEHCSCSPCRVGEHGHLLHGVLADVEVPGTAGLAPTPSPPHRDQEDILAHLDDMAAAS